MGGITLPHLLIVAVLVILLFGTNKLRSIGADLGLCIKGFKEAMSDEDDHAKLADSQHTEVKKEVVKDDRV